MKQKTKLYKFSPMWAFVTSVPFFLLLLYAVRNSSMSVLTVLSIVCIVYLTIALIHHYLDRTLHFEVIVEYVLLALLSLVVLQSMVL
jgi:hypothetical protein